MPRTHLEAGAMPVHGAGASKSDAQTQRCAQARSLLFVPGNRPERFQKAARSGADVVILDLEDSVPAADKGSARTAIAREWAALQACDVPLVVRINASDTAAGEDDLAWLKGLNPRPAAVMVPKAESREALAAVHERLDGIVTLPIIESAAGYAALPSLAAAPGVLRLAVGHIDFMADVGIQCDEQESELAPLRFAVAIATRLNRLAPAVDGVTVQIDDEARLRIDAQRALRFGYGAKLCIHPRQVAMVHQALAPTEPELEWARRVIAADAAAEGAAVQLDGRMVDLPVVLQARRTMARAADSSTVRT
ncbi:CoA ester lyase [Variovorax rhizosphaerae]|uniref:CoA ester lyase n=1 Tax=Variovorax rhizosphaerae TaxID=1836200 RepID=A0ABU8WMT1_9BURK